MKKALKKLFFPFFALVVILLPSDLRVIFLDPLVDGKKSKLKDILLFIVLTFLTICLFVLLFKAIYFLVN